jgi:L-asparaginase/Glu-tRNA(Gln) amidotransferase subunit D
VLSGVVSSRAYAAGSWLKEVGAVGAYDMTPIAALTKLIYLNMLVKYNFRAQQNFQANCTYRKVETWSFTIAITSLFT